MGPVWELMGDGSTRRSGDRWQNVVTLRNRRTGKKVQRSEKTDIPCSPGSDRGRMSARRLLPAFRTRVLSEANGREDAPEPPSYSVSDGISQYIRSMVLAGQITVSSAGGYSYSLKHIDGELADLAPDEVRHSDVVAWMQRKEDEGVGRVALRHAYKLLNQYFRYLLSQDPPAVRANPCRGVPTPRSESKPPNSLRPDLIPVLNSYLSTTSDGYMRRGALIALHTGMRLGEVCALRWQDVDWRAHLIQVAHAVSVRGDRKLGLLDTKGHERRYVPLDNILYAVLKEVRDQLRSRLVAIGLARDVADRVLNETYITSDDAKAFTYPKTLGNAVAGLCRKLDLQGIEGPVITFHGLRHTFATQWLASGGDIKALSDVLGHKDVTTTLDIYAARDPMGKRLGMIKAEAALGGGWTAERGRADWVPADVSQLPVMVAAEQWIEVSRAAEARGIDEGEIVSGLIAAGDAMTVRPVRFRTRADI